MRGFFAQYALKALSDPLDLGWNLLGTRDLHVTASFLTHHASVELIWYAQTAAIVAAHVAAVVVLHALAGESRDGRTATIRSEVPPHGADDRLHALRSLAALDAGGGLSGPGLRDRRFHHFRPAPPRGRVAPSGGEGAEVEAVGRCTSFPHSEPLFRRERGLGLAPA